MSAKCDKKNPLSRSGTNQWSRQLAALSPEYFKVDERALSDLIRFAQRYSKHVKYYGADNAAAGDWAPFFNADITATLAGIRSVPVGTFLNFYRGLQAYLVDEPGRPAPDLSDHFKLFFHLPFLLLRDVGYFYGLLPQFHPFKDFIKHVMERDAAEAIASILVYYKGNLALGSPVFPDTPVDLSRHNTTFDDADPKIQLPSSATERLQNSPELSNFDLDEKFLSLLTPGTWAAYYVGIAGDDSPYIEGTGVYSEIFDALNYNLLKAAFEKVYQSVQRIVLEAEKHIEESLENHDEHPPHYALWLAFLQLFKNSQDHLNTLTARHLDHYYKDILQLCLKAAVPDKVHLLFELSKNKEETLLPAGTQFKAGKDGTGKEVLYQLDNDFVVNRGKVAALKSLFIKKQVFGGKTYSFPFASPVTNSADGQGSDLPKTDPQWKPFGPVQEKTNARIGFAFSDKKLFLREGSRTITLTADTNLNLPGGTTSDLSALFQVSLTTEEGWEVVQGEGNSLEVSADKSGRLTFVINLDGDFPAVTKYDEEVHLDGFGTTLPTVKIQLGFGLGFWNNLAALYFYPFLKDIVFSSLKLKTAANNLRNYTLANGEGVIDPSKPFLPFGAQPEVDSPFIVGSNEVFSKKLASLFLNIKWEKKYNTSDYFYNYPFDYWDSKFSSLNKGTWDGKNNGYELFVFENNKTENSLDLTNYVDQIEGGAEQLLENEILSPSSTNGFIKLEIDRDFGHKNFVTENTFALVKIARGETYAGKSYINYDSNKVPKAPFTPKITELTISYATKEETPAEYFHLYPFGHQKTAAANGRLLPDLPHEGELYIGVENLDPPQRLSLLFQTVDGSSNPLKGENTLIWHYLKDDNWVELDDQYIDDRTDNLTGSGIIGLAVPEEANTRHNILPDGYHWFRMAVNEDADALNNLLSIDAQAAVATFLDQGNDPAFLETALPAETISKLKISDAAIKKTAQPYASFGGKPIETDGHFYTRASERLRHKDRASTMWDYEHLILEEFPTVYKAKCLNHTQVCRDAANDILADNEQKPGHVTVVTVPDLKLNEAINPLRPFTHKKTLVAIDKFLRQRISPFVNLEVTNPKLEEVQVDFEVAFNDNIADIDFYKDTLRDEIVKYLTPWAYAEGVEISFGGKWHKSALINFVEERPYVHYVKDFKMYHKTDLEQADTDWNKVDVEVIVATTARSILVSRSDHKIKEIGN